MKLINGRIPRKKSKKKSSPLDNLEPFQKLREIVLEGKMSPNQQVGILFDQQDVKTLGMKSPWRAAADHLRHLLRDAGLERDYRITKYETDVAGTWFVRVTYSPGTVKVHGNTKKGRGRQMKGPQR